MGRMERRESRRKGGISGAVVKAHNLMDLAYGLLKQFDAKEIEAFMNQLEDALPKANHMLGLFYAASEDLTPSDVRAFKTKIAELFAAAKEFFDRNDDGKINIDDFPKLKRLKALVDLIRLIIPGK